MTSQIISEDVPQNRITKHKMTFDSYNQALAFAKKINTDPFFTKANLLKELEAKLGSL